MKKGLAVFLAIISALLGIALLSSLEAAIGLFNGGGGTIVAFINAAIAYYGGKALYKVFLNKKTESKKEETATGNTMSPIEADSVAQSQVATPQAPTTENSTLGTIIAESNIPETLIPRVIELYKKDPNLISCLREGFSEEQFNEIITGLENGQDVSFFMNEKLSAEQMRAIRENLPTHLK